MGTNQFDAGQLADDLYDAPMQSFADDGRFTLSETEADSAVWRKISKSLEKTLQNLRLENDNPLSELETSELRGRIKQVKEFLEVGSSQPPEENQSSPDLGY